MMILKRDLFIAANLGYDYSIDKVAIVMIIINRYTLFITLVNTWNNVLVKLIIHFAGTNV